MLPHRSVGIAVQWMHVPSFIGIKDNSPANHLANVGQRQSPLLLGHISICPSPLEEEHEEQDDMRNEESVFFFGGGGSCRTVNLPPSQSTGRWLAVLKRVSLPKVYHLHFRLAHLKEVLTP